MDGKLLAYHNGKFTAVSTWRGRQLSDRRVFSAEGDGIVRFADYVGENAGLPLHFLVDVIEEDFRLDAIPHLLGRSRTALVKRKLGQVFRTENYRHFEFQGRESEGRRNDRLLLSALTNDEGLKPWLDAALEKKALIAGLYSVPLLSQPLVAKLGLNEQPHLLLMTRQETGSLRQSYLQDGHLKFSRLTYAAEADLSGLAAMVNEESAKIQQYLNNTRLLPRDVPLTIHFLGTKEELRMLEGECDGSPLRHFELRNLADNAAALRMPSAPEHPAAEALFLHFLAQRPIPNHYAGPRETRYWRLNRTAMAMRSTGIALVVFGGLSASLDVIHGLGDLGQAKETEQRAMQTETRARAIRATYPSLPASPDAMKQTVDLANYLSTHHWSPELLMVQLSRALEELPSIRLQRFQWALTTDPKLDFDHQEGTAAGSAPKPMENAPPPGTAGISNAENTAPPLGANGILYEVAVIEGDVSPFSGYRDALEQVETLVSRLKSNGMEAVPVTLPIETDPKAQLKGSVNEEGRPTSATFTLRLMRRIGSP